VVADKAMPAAAVVRMLRRESIDLLLLDAAARAPAFALDPSLDPRWCFRIGGRPISFPTLSDLADICCALLLERHAHN
jgi:hypothetical protein